MISYVLNSRLDDHKIGNCYFIIIALIVICMLSRMHTDFIFKITLRKSNACILCLSHVLRIVYYIAYMHAEKHFFQESPIFISLRCWVIDVKSISIIWVIQPYDLNKFIYFIKKLIISIIVVNACISIICRTVLTS